MKLVTDLAGGSAAILYNPDWNTKAFSAHKSIDETDHGRAAFRSVRRCSSVRYEENEAGNFG
jgi:hypothetical protein